MHDKLVPELLAGSFRALARVISLIENESSDSVRLLEEMHPHTGEAYRLGITGPSGAGKSTLADRLAKLYRADGNRVGIITVDPTSPFSGGAFLGDRLRMSDLYGDEGVYIRSMATRGVTGGLAARSQEVGDAVEAAGFGVLLFETVGVGQIELDVMEAVDTTLVVLVPESGDAIQMMKAGIIEIADLFVVNKSDREGSSKLRLVLEQLLELKEEDSQWRPLVTETCATTGEGVEELYTNLISHWEHLANTGRQTDKRRQRARQQVERLVNRETITAFWTSARRAIIERELDNMSPYALARLIGKES